MKIIEVKKCYTCPFNNRANGIDFCYQVIHKRDGFRIFKETDDQNTFPKWCPLKNKK